jgi:L-asparaginase
VDIVYAYIGSDGTASRAFVAAGAKGVVSAGFAPGFAGSGEATVLAEAVAKGGLVVVQSTRAGSGRTFRTTRLRELGFLAADNLTPQKARILLSLALTVSSDLGEIERMFATY